MTRLSRSVLLAPFVPAIAIAQESPLAGRSGGMGWLVAVVVVAALALVFWRMQTSRQRRGPHGPQSPTPRGP